MIKHIETVEQFEEETKNGLALVDFFATWCGPCRMLTPVLEDIDEEKALPCDILKVDVDKLPFIAGKFGVQMIPTLILLKDGKILASTRGYMGKPQLLDFVRKSLD